MTKIIEVDSLSRAYKSYEKEPGFIGSIKGIWGRKHTEKVALHPVSFSLESGKIIGLIGANGAGKTTLLKMLSGLVFPSTGTAKVLGFTPWERKTEYLRQMSILLGQKNQLWWDISPLDSFELLIQIYDLNTVEARKRIQHLAQILQCDHVLKTQLRRLSLGERMKMEIIGSLLHRPRVLFLDEPTIGLDIVAQTTIRNFIADYVKQEGPTVVLTSHYMDDIGLLASQLLLLSRGHLVYNGGLKEFTQNSQSQQKISFSLLNPTLESVSIGRHEFPMGTQEFSINIMQQELAEILSQVTKLTGIHNLKIEEADFEDTIRTFMEKESRVLSPGHHH